MAIIMALEEHRPKYEGAAYSLLLITDQMNLEYSMTK